MDNYYVTVVAVESGERSEPVMSRTFSFNQVKSVDDFCKKTLSSGSLITKIFSRDSKRLCFLSLTGFLDFPPVNIIPKDSGATVRFTNPFYFYPELRNAFPSSVMGFPGAELTVLISSNSVSDSSMSRY